MRITGSTEQVEITWTWKVVGAPQLPHPETVGRVWQPQMIRVALRNGRLSMVQLRGEVVGPPDPDPYRAFADRWIRTTWHGACEPGQRNRDDLALPDWLAPFMTAKRYTPDAEV